MITIQETSCCGVMEIDGLSDNINAREALQYILSDDERIPAAHVLFTGVVSGNYGQNFARYIRKYKLGKVIETDAARNPNTKRQIKAWLWTLDHNAIKKWWAKNKLEENDYDYPY